ncbi:nSTAND3 domain-containing NTPase [Sinorhizobium psoraleae]|uniref:Restriction endonuclease n=1 Tax=Sinorhizobium psoraleae TaxID=520838 RepID=A0ABT4KRE8_9HYPH|nr:restriction endonuclease [Sinorhizobium psoraleae]MCZ4093462.1 restriction endonuclease [Sinorhizobium psoraleae]
MTEYDFRCLSHHDFELLIRDLLQAEWGISLESFKSGKDGGIDLRYAKDGDHLIVQCKHYVGTGYSGLLSKLKKEVPKARRLRPKRYVLATSVPLSADNKAEVVALFGKDILCDSDVLGAEDINNLLNGHATILRAHFKLWLSSTVVLERVLHNVEYTQTNFKVEKVRRSLPKYVQTPAFNEALNILERDRLVIIAGPPGVGKSTLADMLLYAHLEQQFQPVVAERDVREATAQYREGHPQIFYYDDFLGSTYLGDRGFSFGHKDDRAILNLVELVLGTPNSRMILTTREHIFNTAMGESEKFKNSVLFDHRYRLEIEQYSEPVRAEILYNHIYFSALPEAKKHQIVDDDFFFEIIRHDKFNPRIIEWLSTLSRVKRQSVHYRNFVRALLDDPSELWHHAYEKEISNPARSLLLALFTLEGRADAVRVKEAFDALHAHRCQKYGLARQPHDLRSALWELGDGFIKLNGSVEVFDPSVLDLMNAVIREAPDNALDLLQGAAFFGQIELVWKFARLSDSKDVMATLAKHPAVMASAIARTMTADRRVEYKDTVAYYCSTFERRLCQTLEIAERLKSDVIFALVAPLADRLALEWKTEPVEIVEATELLRQLTRSESGPTGELLALYSQIRLALLKSAKRGCRIDEMREIIASVSIKDPEIEEEIRKLSRHFKFHCEGNFRDELYVLQTASEVDTLIDDLDDIQHGLSLNFSRLIEIAKEHLADLSDSSNDTAREREFELWSEKTIPGHMSDDDIRELFNSLLE